MGFTVEQERAIHASGSNILISAGAGSGKTTVLSERVIRILKSGVDVDRLIILTFTNAAAAEMKSRIKDKISEIDSLKDQLSKLENAQISTFDSFCLSLVKQYHYLLNLPQDVEIADKILLYSIKQQILDETLEVFYQEKSEAFIKVVDRYFDKGNQALKDLINQFDQGLEMIPDPISYLNDYIERIYSDGFIEQSIEAFELIVRNHFFALKTNYVHLLDDLMTTDQDKLTEFKAKLISTFQRLMTSNTLDDMIVNLNVGSLPIVPRVSKAIDEETVNWLKSKYELVKESFSLLNKDFENLFVQSKIDIINALKETQDTLSVIIKILQVYRDKVKAYQNNHHYFDFIDMMHLAIDLLRNHPEVKETIQKNTYEIMVDEYQDTNDLQEYLVNFISNNNVFMVGDAKQSIYGFRNANPQNFIDKYHQYNQSIGGIAIDLTANFRSRQEVIHGINLLFSPLMSEEIGGVNYQDHQALQFGNHTYDLGSEIPIDYKPEILSYTLTKDDALSQTECEAIIIANKINAMIKDKTPVMNLKGGYYEPARFEHFCIIVDRKSDFEVFEKVLTDASIIVDSITDEKVIASTEVLLFNQVLRLMKCYVDDAYFKTYFKHAFYGVARSFIYECDDQQIIDLFINHSFIKRSDTEIIKDYPSLQIIHEDMLYLSQFINQVPISELIPFIVKRLKIYHHIAKLYNPENVERKLDFLFSKVQSFRRFQFDDLIQYFDDVYSSGELDIEYSPPIDFSKNAVRLMTMHKSKGLEFPFCFYPGLDKSFNLKDINQATLFDKKYGLIIKAYQAGFIDTIWHKIVKYQKKNEIISERIRLFYVALTRAKEKMFLLLNTNTDKDIDVNYDSSGYVASSIRSNFLRYHQFFDCVPFTKAWIVPVSEPIASHQEKVAMMSYISTKPIAYQPIRYEAITLSQSSYSKSMKTWIDEKTKQAIKEGVKLHKLFETFDFYHIETALKLMKPEEAFYLQRFLAHPTLSSIDQATIYQEYPFTSTVESKTQMGVIDLLLIYPDHIDIIDYKLKNIEDEAYLSQLKGYAKYMHDLTKKTVFIYLYSIVTNVLKPLGETYDFISER